jgi:archaemetzincin
VALPKNAFVNNKSPRYRADSLLVYLNEIRKWEEADFAFGITAEDISTTKRDENGNIKKPVYKYADWGIMGLAYRPGRAAIVSTFRLGKRHPQYYTRLEKVCIHELGHNLGLPHCPNKSCVMTDATESINTIDNCQASLCQSCEKKAF